MFGADGVAVVAVDLAQPGLTFGEVAAVHKAADVVLTQAGLSTLGHVLVSKGTPVLLLDQCSINWYHMELGTFLEGVLRQHDASEYRTTLVRNGRFPPGAPVLDVYAALAYGDFKVPVAHLRSALSMALNGSNDIPTRYSQCWLKPPGPGILGTPLWWEGV